MLAFSLPLIWRSESVLEFKARKNKHCTIFSVLLQFSQVSYCICWVQYVVVYFQSKIFTYCKYKNCCKNNHTPPESDGSLKDSSFRSLEYGRLIVIFWFFLSLYALYSDFWCYLQDIKQRLSFCKKYIRSAQFLSQAVLMNAFYCHYTYILHIHYTYNEIRIAFPQHNLHISHSAHSTNTWITNVTMLHTCTIESRVTLRLTFNKSK